MHVTAPRWRLSRPRWKPHVVRRASRWSHPDPLEIIQDAARNASCCNGCDHRARRHHPSDAASTRCPHPSPAGRAPRRPAGPGALRASASATTSGAATRPDFAGALHGSRGRPGSRRCRTAVSFSSQTSAHHPRAPDPGPDRSRIAWSRTAAVLDVVVERGIALEVCPGSNVALGVCARPGGRTGRRAARGRSPGCARG